MLLKLLLIQLLFTVACSIENGTKLFIFPVPFELPYRNERSEQCWLRIEDTEIVETVTIYCYIAHAFLRGYIHDYNSRRMIEDDVAVTLWSEEPKSQEEHTLPKPSKGIGIKTMKDWKVTTIMDTTTHIRIYVSQNADCRLVMYSREGMTNYKVDCDKILYFVNGHMSGSARLLPVEFNLIAFVCTIWKLFNY